MLRDDPIMKMCIDMVYAELGVVPLDPKRLDAPRCAERLDAETQRKLN